MLPQRLAARIFSRPASVPAPLVRLSSSAAARSHLIYHRPRRLRSAGLTLLAAGQASFWASAALLSHQASHPVLTLPWTYAGCALSAAFAALVAAHLRRSVAHIALVDHAGPAVAVTPHALAGRLGPTVVVPAKDVVAAPGADDDRQRCWTFARRGTVFSLFYVVDVSEGVADDDALRALVKGADHLLVYAYKRDACLMKRRWNEWKEAEEKNPLRVSRNNT